MMKPRLVLLLATVLGAATPAIAEESDISDKIAKAPDVALRDLVPSAILDTVTNPFNLQVDVASNAADAPFEATFDITLPDFPNATLSLLVSERDNVKGVVSGILSMAESGNLPGGSASDRDVLAGADCVGIVDQVMINCMMGSAAVQFTASDFMGGNSVDYSAIKALFTTISLDSYRKVFGQ